MNFFNEIEVKHVQCYSYYKSCISFIADIQEFICTIIWQCFLHSKNISDRLKVIILIGKLIKQ